MKLVSKTRQGSKVTKRCDAARTPYRRVMDLKEIPEQTKDTLTKTYRSLNPVDLKRAIGACQDRLIAMAKTKTGREVKRPPNRSYNPTASFRQVSRTSFV